MLIVCALWIYEYIVCSRIIPDTFFEDDNSPDTTPEYKSQPNLPLSFCETHWYSAWSVMERFYSIRNSLTAAQTELPRCQHFSFTDEDANELLNLLHFLKPFVDGMNYCQNNRIATQIDPLPLVESLQKYYRASTKHPVRQIHCVYSVEFEFPF